MNYKRINVNEGITLHKINTDKFKTNLIAVYLTTPLERKNITEKALCIALLRRGTMKLKTQEEINCKLEELYGAEFNCGMDKLGNNEILKFYIESLNDEYTLKKEKILNKNIDLLFDIIFNPLTENNGFKSEYLKEEKENLKQIIEAKKDNKTQYSYSRLLEEMYGVDGYGLYTYGYAEDLNKITPQSLYETYKKILSECKIDIFVSGNISEEDILKVEEKIKELNLKPRKVENLYLKNEIKKKTTSREVIEKMEVTQGKLVIGLDIVDLNENQRAACTVYNAVLGGGANSKLFQNVREKSSLAYTAGSLYIKNKNNIIIKSGIEPKNYEKATEIIKKQLEDMENGIFEEKDIENAKKLIIASYEAIKDEQDSSISYCFGQELECKEPDIQSFVEKIKGVDKTQITDVAKKININTIYFLTSNE